MPLPEKICIESDGKLAKIIGPDGRFLTEMLGPTSITWSLEAGNVAKATIELTMTATRVDVDRVFYALRIDNELKEIASVKFRDGSELVAPEVSERLKWPFPTL
jgi:hypothetical protein